VLKPKQSVSQLIQGSTGRPVPESAGQLVLGSVSR